MHCWQDKPPWFIWRRCRGVTQWGEKLLYMHVSVCLFHPLFLPLLHYLFSSLHPCLSPSLHPIVLHNLSPSVSDFVILSCTFFRYIEINVMFGLQSDFFMAALILQEGYDFRASHVTPVLRERRRRETLKTEGNISRCPSIQLWREFCGLHL